jgi:autotransporter translocation and assembly factor TamB
LSLTHRTVRGASNIRPKPSASLIAIGPHSAGASDPGGSWRRQDSGWGEVNVSVQIDAFPLAGVYALFARDTAGVSGTVNLTVGIAGTRRDPVYVGSIAMNNASFRGFRTPFLDGTLGYRDRRLDAALHLRRSDEPILTVTAHLPLDLSLLPVAERQLPDTLSLRALADSVDLSVLEALTPLVRDVSGVFSADARVQGTWRDPRLGGVVRIEGAAATIPELNVRYENIAGDFGLSGDTILVRSASASSGNGRMDVTGTVRLTELTHPVLALVIKGDRFKALDLKGNVTVAASGRVTLTGPVIGATLAGNAYGASVSLFC